MMRDDDGDTGTIVYDNAVGVQPLYHYAESDVDGYIDPDEYEQPLSRHALSELESPSDRSVPVVEHTSMSADPKPAFSGYTMPSRRFSAIPGGWAPDTKPVPPPIESIPSRRRSINPVWGLVGLIGAVGLLGIVDTGSKGPSTLGSTGVGPCLVGTVIWSATGTVPGGYRIADGSKVVETVHPDLFAAVGPVLPNLVDRWDFRPARLFPATTADAHSGTLAGGWCRALCWMRRWMLRHCR